VKRKHSLLGGIQSYYICLYKATRRARPPHPPHFNYTHYYTTTRSRRLRARRFSPRECSLSMWGAVVCLWAFGDYTAILLLSQDYVLGRVVQQPPTPPTLATPYLPYWSLPPPVLRAARSARIPPTCIVTPSPPVFSQARKKKRLAPPLPRLRQRQRHTAHTPAGCAAAWRWDSVGVRGRGSHGSMLGWGWGFEMCGGGDGGGGGGGQGGRGGWMGMQEGWVR